MKKLITFLTICAILMPAVSFAWNPNEALTLWEYYDRQGIKFPTVENRVEIAGLCGIFDYVGSYEQNVKLLGCLTGKPPTEDNLGASLDIPTPIALFETSLASSITKTDTSMTLVSATDKDGNTLASSTYAFIIDEGTASEEFVIADCTGTACINMTRGVSVLTGTSSVTSLKKTHYRGASVKITDGPQLLILSRILNGIANVPNKLEYKSTVTIGAGDNNKTLITKEYADNLTNAGVATATETVFGGGKLATQTEMASSTYSADNPRLLYSRYATSSAPSSGHYIPVTEADGNLDQGFLDLTEDFAFTGDNSFATATITNLSFSNSLFTSNIYTASTTWTKPSNITYCTIIVIGAGGGGGGGESKAAATARMGGSGGGGGAMAKGTFTASTLTATATITIGSGGAGGAGATDGDGSNGGNGTASSFGNFLLAGGGGGGLGGTSDAALAGGGGGGCFGSGSGITGGSPTVADANGIGCQGVTGKIDTSYSGSYGGGSGGAITTTVAAKAGGSSWFASGGGGGGGIVKTGNTTENASAGGTTFSYSAGGGGAAGGDGVNGTAGSSNTTLLRSFGASGGGGGGGSVAGAGGNGGAGGAGGGAGGGGGACINTHASGTGGDGGDGEVRVFCW